MRNFVARGMIELAFSLADLAEWIFTKAIGVKYGEEIPYIVRESIKDGISISKSPAVPTPNRRRNDHA